MKKLLTLILIIVFSLSTLIYSSSFFIEQASAQLSTSLVQNQVEKQIHKVVDEINSIIPVVGNDQVEHLISTIENDPMVSETVDRYAQILIKDLAKNETNLADNINEDIHGLLYTYTDDFSDLMGDVINPVYKEQIVKNVIDKIDFNDYYDSILDKVDAQLTEKETKVLTGVNFFYENLSKIRSVSLMSAIISLVFSLLLNLSFIGVLWVLILQSSFTLLLHLAVHFGSKFVLNSYLSSYNLKLDYSLFANIEKGLLVIILVSIVLKAITNKATE